MKIFRRQRSQIIFLFNLFSIEKIVINLNCKYFKNKHRKRSRGVGKHIKTRKKKGFRKRKK